eukprot:903041-Prorocentrum_lima.AAC.1
MEVFGSKEQDMSQENAFLEILEQKLQNATTPVTTPPGERFQRVSSCHAGVDERSVISSTPT